MHISVVMQSPYVDRKSLHSGIIPVATLQISMLPRLVPYEEDYPVEVVDLTESDELLAFTDNQSNFELMVISDKPRTRVINACREPLGSSVCLQIQTWTLPDRSS